MPRSLLRLLILAACLPLLAACQRGLTPQQDADLRAVYGRMAANDLAGIEGRFDPQFKRPTLHQGLQFMQGMIPPQPPKVQVLKSADQATPDRSTDYGAMYEYDYPSTAVLAEIQMRQDK